VSCADRKRLEAFKKANQANLALDAEGNLAYLAASGWRLEFVMEKWPEIGFLKTREHD
jgi:Peptide chain release factor RF-3